LPCVATLPCPSLFHQQQAGTGEILEATNEENKTGAVEYVKEATSLH